MLDSWVNVRVWWSAEGEGEKNRGKQAKRNVERSPPNLLPSFSLGNLKVCLFLTCNVIRNQQKQVNHISFWRNTLRSLFFVVPDPTTQQPTMKRYT